jgi:hypothetical protein
MIHRSLLLALATGAACSAGSSGQAGAVERVADAPAAATPPVDQDPPQPSMEDTVIRVNTTDDLNQVRHRYLEALAAGTEAVVEVELAAGSYGPASLSLTIPAGQRVPDPLQVDVVLRGAPGADPAVLRDVALQIAARSVRLENLVVTATNRAAIKVQAGRDVTIRGCTVVDNRWASDFAGVRLVDVTGVGTTPLDVTIEDSWLVGNRQQHDKKPSALVGVKRSPQVPLAQVTVRRTAFLGNDVAAELSISGAHAVRVEDVLVHRTRATGSFLACDACQRIDLDRAGLVVEDLDHVVAGKGNAAAAVTASRLYPRKHQALPSTLGGDAGQVADRSGLAGWDDAVAEAVAGGDRPPTAAVRQKLADALGVP